MYRSNVADYTVHKRLPLGSHRSSCSDCPNV